MDFKVSDSYGEPKGDMLNFMADGLVLNSTTKPSPFIAKRVRALRIGAISISILLLAVLFLPIAAGAIYFARSIIKQTP
jgi:hypothetical protein